MNLINHHGSALRISQWAKKMGLSYRTVWRMVRERKLPPPYQAIQFKTGTIRIFDTRSRNSKGAKAVVYARINSLSEGADLEEQIAKCRLFCNGCGWQVVKVVREHAPGFGERKKFQALLQDPPERLVVSHPSVLSRFDSTVTEILLRNLGCELVMVDRTKQREGDGGMLEDLTGAISSACNLHYGPKRGRLLVEDLSKLVKSRRQ